MAKSKRKFDQPICFPAIFPKHFRDKWAYDFNLRSEYKMGMSQTILESHLNEGN